jgi:hypothetical protein
LHDPQTFGEKLYDMLNTYDKRFSLDHKIIIMQLLSRVMGSHKLCVLGFYTYIVKYLFYRQLRVPSILVALAQSVHDLTPPDAVTPVIRKLSQEFVHPGVGSEVIAAGINAIREVSRRQPWAMEEDLLGDLIEYRKSKDKAVTSAARGLLKLYREVNPSMLKRRERVGYAEISRFIRNSHFNRVKKRAWDWQVEVRHCLTAIAPKLRSILKDYRYVLKITVPSCFSSFHLVTRRPLATTSRGRGC